MCRVTLVGATLNLNSQCRHCRDRRKFNAHFPDSLPQQWLARSRCVFTATEWQWEVGAQTMGMSFLSHGHVIPAPWAVSPRMWFLPEPLARLPRALAPGPLTPGSREKGERKMRDGEGNLERGCQSGSQERAQLPGQGCLGRGGNPVIRNTAWRRATLTAARPPARWKKASLQASGPGPEWAGGFPGGRAPGRTCRGGESHPQMVGVTTDRAPHSTWLLIL